MSNTTITPARFGKGYKHIVTSDGKKVGLDDPRVCHVLPIDFSPYTLTALKYFFKRRGWKTRVSTRTTSETLQYAKELSSGRECLPCAAIIGETCKDLSTQRQPDEITVYYNLDQDGPCQNGGWPLMWETFADRKQLRDVLLCTWPSQRNNYLGRGDLFAVEIGLAFIIGDLLDEAEFTLRCLAVDKTAAMKVFERETEFALQGCARGRTAVRGAFARWARTMKQIKLRADVEQQPKVLLFGGANLAFLHYPITDYFLSQGIIPKLVDFTEFLFFLESEDITRYGFKIGQTQNGSQLDFMPLLLSMFNPKHSFWEGFQAVRCRIHVAALDRVLKYMRGVFEPSGLVYDTHIPFDTIYREGSKYVSANGFTETHLNTGRFAASAKLSPFDGIVNVGTFNCQPAMNTQSCARTIANEIDIPYASIDCEGPHISANQKRLLEAVSVQAKRVRAGKNGGGVQTPHERQARPQEQERPPQAA